MTFLILSLDFKITCYESRYCENPKGDDIYDTKTAIQSMCEKDMECRAIEYDVEGGRGKLCTSHIINQQDSDSKPWEVCFIPGISFVRYLLIK